MYAGPQDATRLQLLQRAVQAHTVQTRQAVTGRGFDRHLLGLRLMLQSEADKLHPLFEDDLFSESQAWKLSTSGLSAGHQFRGTGYVAYATSGHCHADIMHIGLEHNISMAMESTVSDLHTLMHAMCTYCATLDMPAPTRLRFGIESKYSSPRTSTQLFMSAITHALQDMRTLCRPTLHSHL